MGKISFIRVRYIISVLLILLAFGLCIPVRKVLVKSADHVMINLEQKLENLIGLKISYTSLSPSILGSVYINGVSIYDRNDHKMGDIKRIKVSYKLSSLLKVDIQNGVANSVIDGVNLDLGVLLDYILSWQTGPVENPDPNRPVFDITTLLTFFPGDVKLRNVNVTYTYEDFHGEVFFKDLAFTNQEKKRSLDYLANAKGKFDFPGYQNQVTCNLNLSGSILREMDNSFANVKLTNVSDGNFKLSKLCLLFTYANYVFEAHTVQAVKPISISADINVDTGIANASVITNNLSPVSLITSNKNSKELKKLKNLILDTVTTAKFNILEKTFTYKSNTSLSVPDELFPDGVQADFQIIGNEKKVSLPFFEVSGKNCNAILNLDLVYKTLQASGFLEIVNFTLPNGKNISTEMYFDPLEKGFMVFSPQLFVGEKALTAFQLTFINQKDSYDFAAEVYDYTHVDTGIPGSIKMDGSYLFQQKYLQTSIQVNSLFVDSVTEFAQEASPENLASVYKGIKSAAGTFVLSTDAYFSTNFETVSFSLPYILVANTVKDNQVAMVALNGNNESIQINQFSLIYGGFAVDLAATLDVNPDTSDMFFTTDIRSSSIPYHFSGSIINNNISVTGDYGTDLQLKFGKNKSLSGNAVFENLPFSFKNLSILFSLDTDFRYSVENGPDVKISRISVEQANSKFSVSPKLIASGNITKYGAQMNSITYTDYYSSLDGYADVRVDLNLADKLLEYVGLNLDLRNSISAESIHIDGELSNPDNVPLSGEAFVKSLYLSSEINFNNFNLNRFTSLNNEDNVLSASLSASGTLEHPYVALNIEKANILLSTNFLTLKGSAFLEDEQFTINDIDVDFSGMKFYDISGDFSLNHMTGKMQCDFGMNVMNKDFKIPIYAEISNSEIPENGFLPSYMEIKAYTKDISGSLVKKKFDFIIDAVYADGNVAFNSSPNLGLSGMFFKEGILACNLDNVTSARGQISGQFNKEKTELRFLDLDIDLKAIMAYLNLDDLITVKQGELRGDFGILDNFDDPTFEGILYLEKPVVKVPVIFEHYLSTEKITVVAHDNEIHLPETTFSVKDIKRFKLYSDIFLNKWSIDNIQLGLSSIEKEVIPLKVVTPVIKVGGDFTCDLKLYLEGNSMDLSGKVFGDNVNVSSSISSLASLASGSESGNTGGAGFSIKTDLNLTLGTHAALNFDPLLRAVFVPDTSVSLKIDTDTGDFNIDGEVNLKSGDVAYLNRNFYIKSGSIKFNPTELANPQVSLVAETREKDDKGQNVKIILSAENQYVLNFKPRFSSSPAKSENEIQALLGQVVTADSTSASTFLFAAGDYAIQSVIMRNTENKLRDLLNFDIFSLRTNMLQNTLNLSMSGGLSNNISFSNLFDNSTVYIGKYVGSSLYVDAMVEVNFANEIGNTLRTPSNLIFSPEFGLEIEAPFANIRWNVAPDINALMNKQYVPSTSVSLSWKFTF